MKLHINILEGATIDIFTPDMINNATFMKFKGQHWCMKNQMSHITYERLHVEGETSLDSGLGFLRYYYKMGGACARHNNGLPPDGADVLYATRYKQQDLLRSLIAKGADVNIVGEGGVTPLMTSVIQNDVKSVNVLLKAGADVNKADFYSDTALMWAARTGHTKCLEILIESGADVNAMSHYGEAAQWDMSVDFTWNIEDGSTALIKAAKGGHDDCVDKLIEAGADVNKADKRGFTPLIFAARNCAFKTIKRLVAMGADVNVHDHTQLYWIPLHCASGRGRDDVVDLLIKSGADVNSTDDVQCTALMRANTDGCIKLLLEAGADVNMKNNCGHTAFLSMKEKRHDREQRTKSNVAPIVKQ